MRLLKRGAMDCGVLCLLFLFLVFRGATAPSFALPAYGLPAPVAGWETGIARWSSLYRVDAKLIAVVMVLESCGDRYAGSGAGAMGLFQVMPFHFQAGENPYDPETNARRGVSYLAEAMQSTGGDVARSLAWYNGGPGVLARAEMPQETQLYVKRGVALYNAPAESFSAMVNDWYGSACSQAWGGAGRSPVVTGCVVKPAPYDYALSPGDIYAPGFFISDGIHGCEYGHGAIDLVAPVNDDTVYSPLTGCVESLYTDELGNPTLALANQLYTVTLLHGLWRVAEGQCVTRGEPIGTESNRGNVIASSGGDGSHTHYTVYDNRARGMVDPLAFISQ